jgi:peptidoglycan/xylan/chitin deacetylase (PgdA/CDA1 family)
MSIPVLMYHSISRDNNRISVSVTNFKKQMKLMSLLGYKGYSLNKINSKTSKKKIIITFDDGYENIFTEAMPILKKFNFSATCFIVNKKIGYFNDWDKNQKNFKKKKLMNKKQINTWINNGFEVGSHTMNHYNLKYLSNDQKKYQILKPKQFFKTNYGINIQSFSYPFGCYNEDCLKILKRNYKFAVTTKRSRYNKGKFNPLEIPRVPVNSNTSIFKYFLKITTFYEDVKFKR